MGHIMYGILRLGARGLGNLIRMPQSRLAFAGFVFVLTAFIFSSTARGNAGPSLEGHNVTVRLMTGTSFIMPVADTWAGYAAADQGEGFVAIVRRMARVMSVASDANFLAMSQELEGNHFYLVFTGNIARANIAERIRMFGSGEFDKYSRPSFGFELSDVHRVLIYRKYRDIDIDAPGTIVLRPGLYNIALVKDEDAAGNAKVAVTAQ